MTSVRSGRIPPLPPALPGERLTLSTADGKIVLYVDGPVEAPPLLLIHSINAASTAFEVRPLFELYKATRRVYAFDMPGFGLSERSDRAYTIRLMTDAVHDVVDYVRQRHSYRSIDCLGLSLSCEFLARAADERPDAFCSLALISPTGFEGKARDGQPGDRGKRWLFATLNARWWQRWAFQLSTRRPIIKKFLEKTWGSKRIDQELLSYNCLTVRQLGAEHAPYRFIAGYFFSTDILRIYGRLQLPVWMVHGVRGDFVDYHHKPRIEGKANWVVQIFNSGAFPHFEVLHDVEQGYAEFLDRYPIATSRRFIA